jgi:hypothetical protein
VVDKELVEVGKAPHPTEAEETSWRPRSDRGNEPGKVLARECCSSSFCEAAPRTGHDEPRRGEVVAFAEHQVRSEIARRPRLEERRGVGAQVTEQLAEPSPLDGVEERIGHIARI